MTSDHATATWDAVDGHLADDEQVWVELRGRGDALVLGTDRRLLAVRAGRLVADWPWEEVDDVSASGWGAIRIRRRDRAATVSVEPVGDRSEVMQSVTVLALLAVDAARYGSRLEALRRLPAAERQHVRPR
jgi:hypothetical protein